MLACRASGNAHLSSVNNKWRMLIVIPTATVLIAYSQMFERTRLACFNNLKVNSVVIEFIVDGLVCEIMFTSVAAGVDPSTQAHTGLFLHLGTTAGRSYYFFLHSTSWINASTADRSQSAHAHVKDTLEDSNTPFLHCNGCLSFGKYKVFTV